MYISDTYVTLREETTNFMIMFRDQHARKNHNRKICNKVFKRVQHFRYFGTTLTGQNSIHEETNGRVKSGNAWCHSVQNLLSSSLLSKNIKIKIYSSVILPVTLYGCEIWSLTRRKKHRLRVFNNRMLRKIFGPKRGEVKGEWRKLHNDELNDLYSSLNIIRVIKSRMKWAGYVARMGGREVYTWF
jgi:hypothetical protein